VPGKSHKILRISRMKVINVRKNQENEASNSNNLKN
jgi:hypothetical protein